MYNYTLRFNQEDHDDLLAHAALLGIEPMDLLKFGAAFLSSVGKATQEGRRLTIDQKFMDGVIKTLKEV